MDVCGRCTHVSILSVCGDLLGVSLGGTDYVCIFTTGVCVYACMYACCYNVCGLGVIKLYVYYSAFCIESGNRTA